MLHEPVRAEVTPPASVSERIEQRVLFVEQAGKRDLLASVLKGDDVRRALVFTRTKRRANRVMKQLSNQGIRADVPLVKGPDGDDERTQASLLRDDELGDLRHQHGAVWDIWRWEGPFFAVSNTVRRNNTLFYCTKI